jgi:hypothetical protein
MPSPLVLVANEPRAYRETIALALKALRPEAEVIAIEPTDLDAEVKRRRPDVAVLSQKSATVEDVVPSWVLLYPDGTNMTVVSVAWEQSVTGSLALDDLAALVGSA